MRNIITLTSDFSLSDGFVGMMKGVILNINPHAEIVDITHNVPHHNIDAGAFILHNSYRYFPEGTLHVAVVDPGVGGNRRPLAVRAENHIFVAPDNGILKYIYHFVKEVSVYEITNHDFYLHEVSGTFHGRDIFAPTAAHLSTGRKTEEVGHEIDDYVKSKVKTPTVFKTYIKGAIVYIDNFGNLISNIHVSQLMNESICVSFGMHEIGGLKHSYEAVKASQPVALINSAGYLEIAINGKRADNQLRLSQGDQVIVTYER